MADCFQDEIWKPVAVLVALIPFLYALAKDILSKSKPSISYKTIKDEGMPSQNGNKIDKLEIRRKSNGDGDGERLDNVSYLEVKLINDGNQTIRKTDFSEPLRICVVDAEICRAEIVRTWPEGVAEGCSLSLSDNSKSLSLSQLLLHPDDEFWVGLWLSKPHSGFSVLGRVEGIKKIGHQNRVNFWHSIRTKVAWAAPSTIFPIAVLLLISPLNFLTELGIPPHLPYRIFGLILMLWLYPLRKVLRARKYLSQ